MFFINVKPSDLLDRITAEPYAPEYVNCAKVLGKSSLSIKKLGCIVSKKINNSIRGVTGQLDIPGATIPMFRPADIADGVANIETAPKLTSEFEEPHEKSRVYPGDIVLGIAGSVGTLGRVQRGIRFGNINGSSARLAFDSDELSGYILAFLSSKYGQSNLLRFGVGSVPKHLNLEDQPKVEVALTDISAQKYIGDKVRQSEQLRTWAKRSEKWALELFNKQVDWSFEVLKVGKINKVLVSELNGRLDLKYNSPARLALLRHIKNKQITTTELVRLVDISAMIGWKGLTTDYYTNFGPWLLRGVEFRDGVIEFEKLVSVDRDKYLEQPQIHLKEGDIAFSKDGTIGKAIVIPELANDMAAGSTIARLRLKKVNEINPYYLELVLNHDFVQVQVESFATGIAQPHITQEWIAQLIIPRVKYEQVIGEYLSIHHLANNNSKILIQAAKTLVESLIEGQLTERQLIEAQQALEDGDNSLDQAILSKLSAKGYAIEGATPLFSDVDELYSLLEEAAQAEAEE
ncbi:restriction endonuclease subunit S [Enterobacter cloacae]|uniref:restriction endonuclease subunit S n=1 Tax=Enterobacter cloacae TaxID=550 RepID=UPI002A81215B|nr:restriction endonuclease subunit S [Enterobacter cloacae]